MSGPESIALGLLVIVAIAAAVTFFVATMNAADRAHLRDLAERNRRTKRRGR